MSDNTLSLETYAEYEPIDGEEHRTLVAIDADTLARLRDLHAALVAHEADTARITVGSAVTWPVAGLIDEDVLGAPDTANSLAHETQAEIWRDGRVSFVVETRSKHRPEILTTEAVTLDELALAIEASD